MVTRNQGMRTRRCAGSEDSSRVACPGSCSTVAEQCTYTYVVLPTSTRCSGQCVLQEDVTSLDNREDRGLTGSAACVVVISVTKPALSQTDAPKTRFRASTSDRVSRENV